MYYVYRIRSRNHPDKTFLGTTQDVKRRLNLHNSGRVGKTREYRPWRLVFYIAFSRKRRAQEFLEYLQSPAGREFGRKRLWQRLEDNGAP